MNITLIKKYPLYLYLFLLLVINCFSIQIGNGYTTKSKVNAYVKPDKNGEKAFEINENSHFLILNKISKKDSKPSYDWIKIKFNNQVGFIEFNEYNSALFFLKLDRPKYGLVVATSLFVRSEPNTNSKSMEKLQTKDVVEIVEDSESTTIVNGKKGFWKKVKTKNQNVGFVFSPYIMIQDSIESFASLSEFETKESGWIYIKNKPNFIYFLENNILRKKENDQVTNDEFYVVKSRYLNKEGKVFFRIIKQKARLADWYAELEINTITDCYVPAEIVIISNKYAPLYSQYRDNDKQKTKIFDYLGQEVAEELNPQYTNFETFKWKNNKYIVLLSSSKYETDECIGCFEPELYNRVYVLEEKGNSLRLIFRNWGSRSADFTLYDKPSITIRDSPAPEGDGDPSEIFSSEYEFNGKEFILKSN